MFSNLFGDSATSKRFCFFIISGLIIWFFCNNVDIGFMFFAAIAFACSLGPLVDKLSKKMNRTLATTIVLSAALLLLALFILPIIALGAYQVGEFATEFPKYVDKLGGSLVKLPFLKNISLVRFDMEAILSSLSSSSTNIINTVLEFVEGLGSAFLYIFTTIVFVFLFLAEKDVVKDNIAKIFPCEVREKSKELVENIMNKLGSYVIAQTVVSASVWITMTIGLLFFHPYAIVLGIICGILSILPVVGSAISLVISLIASYQFGLPMLIMVTVLFTISHFIENHLVRPYVYSKMLSIHPVIVFLALFVGAKYAGVMGVLFGPPIAMAMCILFDELYVRKMDQK